jgi:3-hydroxymyristoyl/3-hydroxydecanoyl-(acyl carrier protein) dehydratase
MITPSAVFEKMYPAGSGRPMELDWKVDPSLPYFNGHFPGTPILPAVAIIDASTYCLQRALDQADLRVKVVDNAKFLSPIQPNQTVHIELQKQGENDWQIEWTDRSEAPPKVLASLRVSL